MNFVKGVGVNDDMFDVDNTVAANIIGTFYINLSYFAMFLNVNSPSMVNIS